MTMTRSAAVCARAPQNRDDAPYMLTWEIWQTEIVALLQKDFGGESLRHIGLEDIDWPSWRVFFQQGKSPRAAIERALERDI